MHDTEGSFLLFEDGTLFDMEFNKGFVVVGGEFDGREVTRELGSVPNGIERVMVVVGQPGGGFGREHAREQPAAKTSYAEARGLF